MDRINPYEPPLAITPDEVTIEPLPGIPTPASIYVVLIALLVLLALQSQSLILMFLGSKHQVQLMADVIAPVLQLAVCIGVLLRKRLAWFWGRFLSGLQVLTNSWGFAVFLRAYHDGKVPPMAVGVVGLCLSLYVAVFAGLGSRSAKEFFGLTCPKCGLPTTKGLDLLYRRVSCRACGGEW